MNILSNRSGPIHSLFKLARNLVQKASAFLALVRCLIVRSFLKAVAFVAAVPCASFCTWQAQVACAQRDTQAVVTCPRAQRFYGAQQALMTERHQGRARLMALVSKAGMDSPSTCHVQEMTVFQVHCLASICCQVGRSSVRLGPASAALDVCSEGPHVFSSGDPGPSMAFFPAGNRGSDFVGPDCTKVGKVWKVA